MNAAKWGILLIIISIIMGAFGAHYFSMILDPSRLVSLKTGINYQLYMGLGLLALSAIENKFSVSKFIWGCRLIFIGCVLFSFSIYGLVYLNHAGMSFGKAILGPATPIGGTLMIIGWGILLIDLFRSK